MARRAGRPRRRTRPGRPVRRRTRRCSAAPGTRSNGCVDAERGTTSIPRNGRPARRVAAESSAGTRRRCARFVAAGGRLVLGGAAGNWLDRIVPRAPDWSPTPVAATSNARTVPQLTRVRRRRTRRPRLVGRRLGAAAARRARPMRCSHSRRSGTRTSLAARRRLAVAEPAARAGRQRARSASRSPGRAARPVVFLESYHGYGAAEGFAAVPGRWWTAFAPAGARDPRPDDRERAPLRAARRRPSASCHRRGERTSRRSARRSRARTPATARSSRSARTSASRSPCAPGSGGTLPPTRSAQPRRRSASPQKMRPHSHVRPTSDADVLAVGRILARVEGESRP